MYRMPCCENNRQMKDKETWKIGTDCDNFFVIISFFLWIIDRPNNTPRPNWGIKMVWENDKKKFIK